MSEISSKVKVLVTGADGMLGNNIVVELLARDHEVYCFVEKHKDGGRLKELPVKIVKGDLNCEADLDPVFKEIDYVINTAGITAMWPSRMDLSWNVNYHAVVKMVSLAKKYNLKRFVQIGTANSFGAGPIDHPGTEENPYTDAKYKLDYQDTKRAAQDFLVQEFKGSGFPVVVVNPTFMLGKYDTGNGSNKMVLSIYKGKVPGYSPGGKNYVNVKDVATAACNALTKGRLGECYIAGNMNMTYKDGFAYIAEALGVRAPKIGMPRFVTVGFGGICSLVAAITGKAPDVSYKMAKIACADCYYSPEKAVSELDMPQSSVADGVRDSLEWFKEMGLV